MDPTPQDPSLGPAAANRRSFLLLRWLLIILAAYLTLFTNIEEEGLVRIFLLMAAFALSNVLIGLLPLHLFSAAKSKHLIAGTDAAFISGFLYNLRIDQIQLHLPFIGIVILATFWPDLRIVLFALFVVSLLFGSLTNFQLFDLGLDVPIDAFLALALLFIVAIFYCFLVDRFDRDTETSEALIRERRRAENISDIVRKLSTSLEFDGILKMLVDRLAEVMPNLRCSIFRVDTSRESLSLLASSDSSTFSSVSLEDLPVLRQAIETKATATLPDKADSGPSDAIHAIAVPMVSRDEVVALLYLERDDSPRNAWEHDVNFIETIASAAANALANAERFERMKHIASSDSLTKLANHETFRTRLSHEVERARRHNRMVSLLLIDLDLLKSVNDRFGHPVGDRVIRSVADVIRQACREIDLGARYGGEEYAVILPEANFSAGLKVGERLRHAIEQIDEFPVKITASIGVATFPRDGGSDSDLIAAADQALYIAKRGGRNRVASLREATEAEQSVPD